MGPTHCAFTNIICAKCNVGPKRKGNGRKTQRGCVGRVNYFAASGKNSQKNASGWTSNPYTPVLYLNKNTRP